MLILKAKSWVISLTNNTLFLGDQSRCVFTTLLRKTPSEIRESWVVVLLGAKVAALPRRSGSSILDISIRVGGGGRRRRRKINEHTTNCQINASNHLSFQVSHAG